MKRYFLFDLDGTLNDTGAGIMPCVQYALTEMGLGERPEGFLRQFIGPPLERSFAEFCGLGEEETGRAVRLYREKYFSWGIYQSPLYPGIEGLLERLGQKAVLCVATSKREDGARKILTMRGIEGRFAVVAGDDGTRPSKALVVAEALRLLGGPDPAQAVMVGDRRYDVEGAAACGVETIGAGYGYGLEGELEQAGARWVAGSVRELERLCLDLAEGGRGPGKSA